MLLNARRKIKVLVVDDSAIVRRILTDALSGHADIEVVGTAPDAYVARDKILSLRPDVITLDIEMPGMDGLTFLRKFVRFHPLPVIVISSLTQGSCQAALEALRLGAVDVLAKPGGPYSVAEMQDNLAAKVRAAATSQPKTAFRSTASVTDLAMPAGSARADMLIAIGASTGGTQAIERVLTQLPENSPAVAITQHIPAGFSAAFAERLNRICKLQVKEASDGDLLVCGRALIAPGDFHMVVRRSGEAYRVLVKSGPRVEYQRPSVDVLFNSVAEAAGNSAVGVLLTGMGADGAQGLLNMKRAGAYTIAQDEESCIVFGMPKEAIRLGAADKVVSLSSMAGCVLARFQGAIAGATRMPCRSIGGLD
jgi:two-component system chemotaxis response regulator CheB